MTITNNKIHETAKTIVKDEVFCEATDLVNNLIIPKRYTDRKTTDIRTWYIVSDYLAEQITKHGGIVIYICGLHFWGCTSENTPLSTVHIIKDIATDILK